MSLSSDGMVIKTADGVVAVNERDREKTLELYEKIEERVRND